MVTHWNKEGNEKMGYCIHFIFLSQNSKNYTLKNKNEN